MAMAIPHVLCCAAVDSLPADREMDESSLLMINLYLPVLLLLLLLLLLLWVPCVVVVLIS